MYRVITAATQEIQNVPLIVSEELSDDIDQILEILDLENLPDLEKYVQKIELSSNYGSRIIFRSALNTPKLDIKSKRGSVDGFKNIAKTLESKYLKWIKDSEDKAKSRKSGKPLSGLVIKAIKSAIGISPTLRKSSKYETELYYHLWALPGVESPNFVLNREALGEVYDKIKEILDRPEFKNHVSGYYPTEGNYARTAMIIHVDKIYV